MLKNLIDFIKDDEKRTITLLIISALSLVMSWFDIGHPRIDAAWVAVFLCGIPIIKEAITGLVTEFDIKADVLVSIALIASVFIGEIFAAGEVALIMVLGALLEERTVAKARAGIEKMIDLTPRTARVIRQNSEAIVPAEDIKVGDVLRVLAGETIAVDGIIVAGKTSINAAVMTGESLPVDKEPGDEVYSGTVNQFGTFEMEATRVGEDSSLQRMIRLVESSDAGKAKIVRIADRWATWIVVMALASALGTWLITGEIIRAVTILVVFCPCALVLATPTAIVAGIGNATKYGILVSEGDALERLSQVTKIAFDKTGTLTHGEPAVKAVKVLDPAIDPTLLQVLAGSAERHSEHPLGKAIVSYMEEMLGQRLIEPQDFTMVPGGGVRANVQGYDVVAGNQAFLKENAVNLSANNLDSAEELRNEGCTVVFVALNGALAGFIALADSLRQDSAEMIQNIQLQNLDTLLLTGDHSQTAAHIAKIVGIATVHSDCLPEEKVLIIEEYQNHNHRVCMVGDGINDAPALKTAFVGVAMGGVGSDIAVAAADIALVSDDIKAIPHLLRLAKKTMNIIRFNLSFSMLLNFVAVALAMMGILGPVTGALVHNAGSVLVVLNSARLLGFRTAAAPDQAKL